MSASAPSAFFVGEAGEEAGEEGGVTPMSYARAGRVGDRVVAVLCDRGFGEAFLGVAVAGAGGELVGVRNGGGARGDVLTHDSFLEAFALLLGTTIDAAAFLSDPHQVKDAAIGAGPAAFVSVVSCLVGLLLSILAIFAQRTEKVKVRIG